ncbi:hypothetical protein RRG08_020242 [Elysia crispata]|uniref:Uncharacterized protein n=1 Tax=Elysia crispata TaxID=231223 RepID=A0AAE1DRB7_9GAST|nr:hypothetical protein RRG08_020242 [Elysia crispata]
MSSWVSSDKGRSSRPSWGSSSTVGGQWSNFWSRQRQTHGQFGFCWTGQLCFSRVVNLMVYGCSCLVGNFSFQKRTVERESSQADLEETMFWFSLEWESWVSWRRRWAQGRIVCISFKSQELLQLFVHACN